MKSIIFATGNENKMVEVREILKDLRAEVFSLKQAGINADVEENGTTFEENAIAKASVPAKYGYIGVADDSGLCVDALGGEPGIYSARYSGGDDEDNNDLILKKLENETNRSAKYVCAIACVFPDHSSDFVVKGECYGQILRERCGDKGFGYDPLFYYEPFGKTFAEIDLAKKNEVSHRGVAMRHFVNKLSKVLK